MAKQKNVHTVYIAEKQRWQNEEEGVKKPLSSHLKQETAVAKGRQLAKARKVEHLIHGKDGKIHSRNSYGHDPFPPRG